MTDRDVDSKKGGNKIVNELISWIMAIVMAIVLALFIKAFIFNTTQVDGLSMYPTLNHNDRLIAERVTLYFEEPSRNDIVIFNSTTMPGKDFIKRVIGVEGDKIALDNGHFYVNGEMLTETYIKEDILTYPGHDNTKSWIIGEDKLFVVGDNREIGGSYDSRDFGEIDVDTVKGIAVFRYYPFNNLGLIN